MTFEIFWATGNEQCTNCKENIKKGEPYLKLLQNRWAKPCLCKTCMLDLFRKMEDISDKREFNVRVIPKRNGYLTKGDTISISKNGWMQW